VGRRRGAAGSLQWAIEAGQLHHRPVDAIAARAPFGQSRRRCSASAAALLPPACARSNFDDKGNPLVSFPLEPRSASNRPRLPSLWTIPSRKACCSRFALIWSNASWSGWPTRGLQLCPPYSTRDKLFTGYSPSREWLPWLHDPALEIPDHIPDDVSHRPAADPGLPFL